MGRESADKGDLQAQVDELTRRVSVNRSNIDALETRADRSDLRAAEMEARAKVDRDMIAELQEDGVLSREHAEQLEQALKSSRTIGAAIGLIMASRQVREDEAFTILRNVSQNSNRKLRELADDLVATGGEVEPVQ